MKFSQLLSLIGYIAISLMVASVAYAGIPNTDHPTTFLGPTVRVGATNYLNNASSYSVLGEAGLRNFRLGGTLGWALMQNQRLKVSVDLLTQRITYPFFSGNTDQWVNQGALGGYYEYLFLDSYNSIMDVSAYLSHANSKSLSSVAGAFVNSTGVTQTFLNERRIAGSNAAGGAIGVSVTPSPGTYAGIDVNYDNVRYDKNFPPSKDATGFGGTAKLRQMLSNDLSLGLEAAVRQPFNYYHADITRTNLNYYGVWAVGLEGGYTVGKNTLPSTYNIALSFNYSLDQHPQSNTRTAPMAMSDDFLSWTSKPAIYMPQVLAIPDERTVTIPGCSAPIPTVIGTIPTQTGGGIVDAAAVFSPATGLTYSITTTPAPAVGNSVTINSAGLVTIVAGTDDSLTATVTATNACGASASTSFDILIST